MQSDPSSDQPPHRHRSSSLGAALRLLVHTPGDAFAVLILAGIAVFVVVVGLGWGIVAAVQSRMWVVVVGLGALLAWLLIHVVPELTVRGDQLLAGADDSVPEKRWEAKKAVRDALVSSITGASVIAGLVLAANTLDVSGRQGELSNQQQLLNARAQELDRESKHSDQFMKAVTMMAAASSTPDVRAGGIYSLEQLGLASSDDQRRITETLAAYLRTHSQRPLGAPADPPDPPIADVQAAISVLGRHHWARQLGMTLDLRGVDLRAADLHGADLGGADLTNALLSDADLSGADLTGAVLAGATLAGRTDLTQTTLTSAILVGARMDGVDARGAKGLTADQLAPVSTSRLTVLPADVRPPSLQPPPSGQSLTIEAPVEGAVVSIAPDLHGTTLGMDSGTKLWMVTVISDKDGVERYYPQGVSFPDYRTGINRKSPDLWCKEKGYVGSAADAGKAFTVLVVGADTSADAAFLTYLRVGPKVGFPAWRYLPSGVVVHGRVHVTRDTRNLSTEEQTKLEADQAQACPPAS